MANKLQRFISKLDFWDKDENKKQQEQFDREDREEEERRKREQVAQASRTFNQPKPRSVNAATPESTFDPAQPLKKAMVASQSDFTPPQKAPAPAEQEIDSVYQRKLKENVEREEKSLGFLEKHITDRDWKKRAESAARAQAASEIQERNGGNATAESKAYTERAVKDANQNSKNSQQAIKNTKTAVDIARWLPGAGAGELGANLIRGNFAGSKEADDTLLREQVELTNEQIAALTPEDRNKFLTIAKGGLGAGVLDFVGLGAGGLIKNGAATGLKKATVKGLVKDIATKEGAKALGKNAVVGGTAGAAIGGVGTIALGGDSNEALENAGSGFLAGAFGSAAQSPFDSAVKLTKANKKVNLSNAINVDDVTDNIDAAVKSASSTREDAPKVAGAVEKPDNIPVPAAPSVDVAPGIKSTNLAKVQSGEVPSQLEPIMPIAETMQPPVRAEAPAPAPLPTPAMQSSIPAPDGRALAKADEAAQQIPTDNIMADFNDAVNVPLQKPEIAPEPVAVAQPTQTDIAQTGELPVELDAAGNPVLKSDVAAAQEMIDAGVAPVKAPIVDEPVDMADLAAQATREQVNTEGAAAPRTYEQAAQRVEDPALADEVLASYPEAKSVNIEATKAQARATIGSMTDEQLVQQYAQGVDVSTPQKYFEAMNLVSRLGRTEVLQANPTAGEIVSDALSAMAGRTSEGGQILRVTQVLFDEMPAAMKEATLIKQLKKAGVDMHPDDRLELLRLIERSDDATAAARALEDRATVIMEGLKTTPGGADVPALTREFNDISVNLENAKAVAGEETHKMVSFYDSFKPAASIGGQAADIGRGLMLSGIGGRFFDNVSTAGTFLNDVTTSNLSALIGKGLNKASGNNNAVDTFMDAGTLVKGFKQGLSDVKDSFSGKGRVDSAGDALLKKAESRSGIEDTRNPFTKFVNNVVDIPTKLTQGLEGARVKQLADQEAAQLGLQGGERELYAKFRTLTPTTEQARMAEQVHMKVNNLHENKITGMLNNFVRGISGKYFTDNPQVQGALDVMIKNQIAPFTSFLGGNFHRALTDKNMLYNVFKGVSELKKGNIQGFADQAANLGVNSVQALAGGYVLSQMGVLSETDADGKEYGGLYIHIGDRYIPVSILGAASVPIILGHAVQASQAESDDAGEIITKSLGRAVSNTFASAGVASVFGGDNNLQENITNVASENDNVVDPFTKYAGALIRQYVNPGLFGDINAAANNPMPFGMNPNASGLAPLTDAEKVNENGNTVKDVQKTELNRTMAGIPGLSQTMERNPEKQAADLLDRGIKSTRESGEMADKREQKQSVTDMEKQYRKDGLPLKDEEITKAIEDGEYDKAIAGYQLKRAKAEADPKTSEKDLARIDKDILKAEFGRDDVSTEKKGIDARLERGQYDKALAGMMFNLGEAEEDKDMPESDKKELRDDITRVQITKDGNFDPKVIKLYSSISNTEWQNMLDPEDEDFDPDTAALLEEYDTKLAEAGVSRDDKNPKRTKYYEKGSGRGRGGSGSKGPKMSTDIATQRFTEGGGFTPIKARAASVKGEPSPIPVLQKAPINDTSKLKKISVTKGGRR